jgi:hypothetical protein
MAEDQSPKPLWADVTSWASAVEVLPVQASVAEGADPRSVYLTIADAGGSSSYVLNKEAAGELAVQIFAALARLGDGTSQQVLNRYFKRHDTGDVATPG